MAELRRELMDAGPSSNLRAPPTGVTLGDLLLVATLLVCIVAFGGSLLDLVRRWTLQEEYSHGFLIPLVTAWLLWTRRDLLRQNIGQPSWIGLALILIALAMLIIGALSAIFIFSQIGFVVALMGIVFAIGGYSLFKIAFIPIAFLLFAIPLPHFIDAVLTLRLQLISSELGAFFIRMAGIPVYLDGNIIDMGNYKLQVVEACSGLRYLYPLFSLSFLAAYLFKAPLWQRVLVCLSAIPIAIGMNGFRIGLVGIVVDRWGTQTADGALHFFEGWVIFVACAAILVAEMYLLTLISGRALSGMFYRPETSAHSLPSLGTKKTVRGPLAACFVFLCAGGLAVFLVSGRSEIIQERTRFVEFPARLGQWQGYPSLLDEENKKILLGLDDYILSDYSKPDGNAVNLYVGYYASQRGRGESPHSPIECIPAGGWTITKLQRINYVDLGGDLPLNRVVIKKGISKQLVYYWFDERGRNVASEYWAKLLLLTDAVMNNRTDGALIRLTTQIRPNESEKDADRRLQSFMRIALPQLTEFLPSRSVPRIKAAIVRRSDYQSQK
jgi:exosortase D (VPLPA-CTERM-specific)